MFCWPSSPVPAYFGLLSASHLKFSSSRSRLTRLSSSESAPIVTPPSTIGAGLQYVSRQHRERIVVAGCSRGGRGEQMDSHGGEGGVDGGTTADAPGGGSRGRAGRLAAAGTWCRVRGLPLRASGLSCGAYRSAGGAAPRRGRG